MKLIYGSLAALLFALGIVPLQAGPVGRVGGLYGNTNYYATPTNSTSTFPETTVTITSSAQQAVQNAVSVLNPQMAGAPGVSVAASPVNVMQTSFYYNPYTYGAGYGYTGFYGGSVSYQRVFAVNNFGSAGPAPGSATSSPAFNAGVVGGRILSDPAASPEPGSILLFGSGVGALLLWRRRRQS